MISYTKFSDKVFNWSYRWRSKYFRPLLALLTKLKVSPNDITFFRLLFILPLIYFFFIRINLLWMALFYILFWVVDLLDGALARYQNKSSDRGKFLDTVADVFVYSFMLIGMIYVGVGGAILFSYQILIHITVYLLAIIKKQEGQKTDWLINPKPDLTYLKFSAHTILGLYVFFNIDIIEWGFALINILMTILSLYYFYSIYNKKVWKS